MDFQDSRRILGKSECISHQTPELVCKPTFAPPAGQQEGGEGLAEWGANSVQNITGTHPQRILAYLRHASERPNMYYILVKTFQTV